MATRPAPHAADGEKRAEGERPAAWSPGTTTFLRVSRVSVSGH